MSSVGLRIGPPLPEGGESLENSGGGGNGGVGGPMNCGGESAGGERRKSILKSPDASFDAGECSAAAGRTSRRNRFRQHSMDANSSGRSVKFFLESEGSDTSLADNSNRVAFGGQLVDVAEEHFHHRRYPSPCSRCPPTPVRSALLSPREGHQSAAAPESASFRRTSLPVQSNVTRQSLLLQSQVNSARGLLMDLLATSRRDLSPNVAACLKAVTALLSPASPTPQQQQQSTTAAVGGPMQSSNLSLSELGVPQVVESPYSGEVHIASTSKPRVSNITFSTVTSATGLPTIAAEPSRSRSSSYWKPHSHATSTVGGPKHHGQAQHSTNHVEDEDGEQEAENEQQLEQNDNGTALAKEGLSNSSAEQNSIGHEAKTTTTGVKLVQQQQQPAVAVVETAGVAQHKRAPPLPPPPAVGVQQQLNTTTAPHHTAKARAGDEMTGQPKSGSLPGQQKGGAEPKLATAHSNGPPPRPPKAKQPTAAAAQTVRASAAVEDAECCSSEQSSSIGPDDGGAPAVYKTAVDGTVFDRAELERDATLKQVQEWSFPIFRFAEKHKRTVLSRLTYAIFKEADLFRTFKISFAKFFNYFHALEAGYWDIPYHNRIHAADVLHGTYYLTCHPVHAFCGYHHSSELDDEDDQLLDEAPDSAGACGSPTCQLPHHNHHFAAQHSGGSGFDSDAAAVALPLAQSMSSLELMALYTAAAMHDYDHPGRTNAFLVASEDRKAILYNDRSVLENHHAAESWRLLSSQQQNHFIENLDSAETKRFRYLVLEYILATDLKQHFDIIMQFNERAPDMDLANEADRVLVSLMLIKFADINSPAKPYSLHRQWTERICQEFYEQGDEEKGRLMAVSPYMDRNEPAVAKLQDSFIAHIVNPLAMALNETGLFPVLPGLPESELIINLKHNHQKWLLQIEAEQHEKERNNHAAADEKQQQGVVCGGESASAMNNNNVNGVKPPLSPPAANNNCAPGRKGSARGGGQRTGQQQPPQTVLSPRSGSTSLRSPRQTKAPPLHPTAHTATVASASRSG